MKYTKNNPLRVVTLCSGYDSQCLALNRLRKRCYDMAWEYHDKLEYELKGYNTNKYEQKVC